MRFIKSGAIVLATAVALWVAIGVTTTHALGRREPALALSVWPAGAKSRAAAAERLVTEIPKPAERLRALTLARGALAREPVNVDAARTLAIANGFADQKSAGPVFAYAERLSRRDLMTQLWLIESSVQRGDVLGALRHYDRALRTSARAEPLLLPTLVAASDDPSIARGLGPLIASRPAWWRNFTLLLIRSGKNPRTLSYLIQALRIDPGNPEDHDIARLALQRLADANRYDVAALLYAGVTRRRPDTPPLVRDGDFEHEGDFLPFDWSLTDQDHLSAAREVYGPSDSRLKLTAGNGVSGDVARQMLVLRPGRYTLSGEVGDVTGGATPIVGVTCADGRPLRQQRIQAASGRTRFQLAFDVSGAACATQWLVIVMPGGSDGSAWIDKLNVIRSTS